MSAETMIAKIKSAFPGAVVGEVEGCTEPTFVLEATRLVDVATYLRDQLGLDCLSSVTAVDREERLEVVYHLYATTANGAPLVFKVYLPDKANPQIASVTPIWPGAELQEREIYDLFGIRFVGHPNLKRIFTWEGFPGHPLRKDFEAPWSVDTDEVVAIKYATPES